MVFDCHSGHSGLVGGDKVRSYMLDLDPKKRGSATPRGVELEYLFRAPYNSIVDIDPGGHPVFESEDFTDNVFVYPQNLFLSQLMTDYLRLENLVHPNIVIHHEESMHSETERYLLHPGMMTPPDYVVCFDIDGVCHEGTFSSIQKVTDYLQTENVAVGVVTARPSPLTIPVCDMGLLESQEDRWKTPLYFNTRTRSIRHIPSIKARQLKHLAEGYGIQDHARVLLLDDNHNNVSTARKHGFSAWQVDDSFMNHILLSKIKEWVSRRKIQHLCSTSLLLY